MTILEALNNKQIRFGGGREFSEAQHPGEWLYIDGWNELPQLLADNAAGYAGSAFVRFDEELPAAVPVNNPAHTWAWALFVGDRKAIQGAVVIWSTEAIEKDWRAAQVPPVSFEEFNVRRAGGDA